MKRTAHLALLSIAFPLVSNCQDLTYVDDFSSGALNTSFWRLGSGDGVVQANGVLNISRNESSDHLVSQWAFRGPFDITFDMKVDTVAWGDPFHGIALTESPNTDYASGVGFGFSVYGEFFSTQVWPTGSASWHTATWYGPKYSAGTWYQFHLVGNETSVDLYVNDVRLFSHDFSYIDRFYVQFPGLGWETSGGTTLSQVDNFVFVLHANPIPEPCGCTLICSGGLLLFWGRRVTERYRMA